MFKNKLLLILLIIPLFSSYCKREGDDCHRTLVIQNNSAENVILCHRLHLSANHECSLLRISDIAAGDFYNDRWRDCWEDILKDMVLDYYIVDPANFNDGGFYDCDSIEYKNTILKHFILTEKDIPDLRETNFTITYP